VDADGRFSADEVYDRLLRDQYDPFQRQRWIQGVGSCLVEVEADEQFLGAVLEATTWTVRFWPPRRDACRVEVLPETATEWDARTFAQEWLFDEVRRRT